MCAMENAGIPTSGASVTVVIPAFNEQGGIAEVVQRAAATLRDSGMTAEILVVDDGSTDQTAQQAASAGAKVMRHASNRGYGAALKTGILAARHELIVITDADGTYPVDRIPDLARQMDRFDMVIGARTGENVHIPLIRKPAKWMLMHLANYVTKAKIQDLNSGLRAFPRAAALQYFNILPDQFSFTSTITIAMHCDRYAVHYEPIDYYRRTGKSKIVPWDAATFAALIVRIAVLFKPLRVFVPIVLMFCGYAVIKAVVDLMHQEFVSQTAILAMMGSIQFLLMGLVAEAVATRLNRVTTEPYTGVRLQRVTDTEPPAPAVSGQLAPAGQAMSKGAVDHE